MTYLKNLNFSEDLFTNRKSEIMVAILYKTLDGKKFEFSQTMQQTNRADGLYNLPLTGEPKIKKIE
jgi:hypothetical protein